MDEGDLALWENATAFSRQIEIRNRIISQKLPFPQALFNSLIGSPSLAGLIPLGVLSTGQTATSTYYGKANFGDAANGAIPDNLLVLHFLREEGKWLFDSLRIVKIGGDGELLLQIRNADFSFLKGEEFQPAPFLPPIPQPVEAPTYVAEAWIDASGYEVTLTINGRAMGPFKNLKTTELIIGGLRRGDNTIKIDTHLSNYPSGTTPKVEVAIYAADKPDAPARRVYHFRPGVEVPATTTTSFVASE